MGKAGSRNGLLFTLLFLLTAVVLEASQPAPDFIRAHILITPQPEAKSISGEVTFELYLEAEGDSIRLDAHQMEFHQVKLNGTDVPYTTSRDELVLQGPDRSGKHELYIAYKAFPRQAVYFIGWGDELEGNEQIWTQGQGKDSSHWVPVVDKMDEKVEFDLSIRFDSAYQVVANGRLVRKTPEGARTRWDFDMEKPMSSYLLAFAVGPFDQREWKSDTGIPILGFYPRGEMVKARWTYRYMREIFDFLEAEIGYAYPWRDYKQVPVSDFLYAGMENTGSTFFSDRYLVDSLGYNDQTYINVNAHELAHQWFGNLVTESDGSQHWLHEGFATYYAYLTEMHLLGADAIYWKLFDTAIALDAMDKAESLLDPGASSLTFYEKGAWALFMLKDRIGEKAFAAGIRRFLEAYAYRNASVDDFMQIMTESHGNALDDFYGLWLEGAAFPMETAMNFLQRQSPAINTFLELQQVKPDESSGDTNFITEAWELQTGNEYREHLLRSYRPYFTRPFLDTLFLDAPLEIRKVLLETTLEIEEWMIPSVETWLDAPSYDLREAALFRLWIANPTGRPRYLEITSGNGSLENQSLQQLWWMLAVFTESYASREERMEYLDLLRRTTGPEYSWEIRENGIAILNEVKALNNQNINDIVEATEHHSWQFRKFARSILEQLLADDSRKEAVSEIIRTFPEEEYGFAFSKIENR